MAVYGFRCSNSDIAYCVLSGSRDAPIVEESGLVAYPKGFADGELLRWLHQEVCGLYSKHEIVAVGIKRTEVSVKRSNSLEVRIQCEAIVTLAAAEAGCLTATRKVKQTIAKGLGLKGKAKYLDTELDTSPIAEYESMSSKLQEAVLVAWSCM